MKKNITQLEVAGKKVLIRVDFNVPIKEKVISSDARIRAALPTIEYLLDKGAKIILCSHLGRPKGKVQPKYSLKPVAKHLSTLIENKVIFVKDTVGEDAIKKAQNLKEGEVLLLENVRFNPQEEENEEDFAKKLASLADIYVNDAFGTSHRKEASMHAAAKLLPSAVGFLVQKELEVLNNALNTPRRPFVVLLGGAKVSDKLGVIDNLVDKVDTLIIGGGMSYTFIKALGGQVGKSLVDTSKIEYCYNIIKKCVNNGVKLLLPVDDVCNTSIESKDLPKVFSMGQIPKNYMGLDIGPKTIKLFKKEIKRAKTIIWNGPFGVFENAFYQEGTKEMALALAKSKAFSIVGGGDSLSAIEQFGLAEKISHLSTGGGASLMLLEGKTLPGVEVIQKA